MNFGDLTQLVPLAAALALAWGVYATDRRWEDQKRFEREREDQRQQNARRSLAAALLAEVTAVSELISVEGIDVLEECAIEAENCAIHLPIREREVLKVYVEQISMIGILGIETNSEMSRHYTMLQAFLDENQSISDAASLDVAGHRYDRTAMRVRVRAQLDLLGRIVASQHRLRELLSREVASSSV